MDERIHEVNQTIQVFEDETARLRKFIEEQKTYAKNEVSNLEYEKRR